MAGLIAAVAMGAAFALRPAALPRQPTGLFTSLPIVWGESDRLGDLLASDGPRHWARGVIEQHGALRPLDTLSSLPPGLTRLIVAQPRPLAPAENVALDAWVRGGGRVLLFADPLLTEPSRYAIGDPRRPQDVAMLSPILSRWGLELTFAEDQPGDPAIVADGGYRLPVHLSGAWRALAGNCTVRAAGLIARCTVGRGRVLAVADAALLAADDAEGLRSAALEHLIDQAFVAD